MWGHKKQTNSTWSNQRGLRQGKDLSVSQDYGELNQGKSSSYPVGRGIIRCFLKDHLYPQQSQRLKSFIVAMMTFIFKNNFSTTSRGHNENKTRKLSSVDPVIPFPEQKRSSPLKVVKHIDNSIIGTCYPSLNSAYILLIFASHLFGVFLFIYFWLHTNPR